MIIQIANSMTDRDLLARIAEKDQQAFDLLYNRYERLFYYWVFSRLKDYDVACELTQVFWISIWHSPMDIKSDEAGSAKGYLLRNLTFRILKYVQREMNRFEKVEENLWDQRFPDLTYTHISEEIYAKEILQLIDDILKKLPQLTRTIYELRFVKNLSVKETAEALLINEKTVRNGLSSALSAIRGELTLSCHITGSFDKAKIVIPLLILLLEKQTNV